MTNFDRSLPYIKWPKNELYLEATRFGVSKDILMALRMKDIVHFLEMNAMEKSDFLDSVDDLIASYGTHVDPLVSASILEEIRTNFMEEMESSGVRRVDESEYGDTFVFVFSRIDHGGGVSRMMIDRTKHAGYGVHYIGHSKYLGTKDEWCIIVRFGE